MACKECEERRKEIDAFVRKHVRAWTSATQTFFRSHPVHVHEPDLTPPSEQGKDDEPTS